MLQCAEHREYVRVVLVLPSKMVDLELEYRDSEAKLPFLVCRACVRRQFWAVYLIYTRHY